MTGDENVECVQNSDNFNLKGILSDSDHDSLYNNANHICKYYEESVCLEKFENIDYGTQSVLSFNIRSLPGKFTEFKEFLTSSFGKYKPDIICLQEIWNIPYYENFFLDGYHPLEYKVRDKTGTNSNVGGGVGVYIRDNVTFQPQPELSVFIPRVCEAQFFKIKHGKNKFTLLGNIYRPNSAPYADIKRFNVILNEILDKIKSKTEYKNVKDIIICGDMNIDLLKSNSHNESGTYLDTLLQNCFLQLVTLPTRIGNRSATIIDHISTNISDDNFDTGIIISDISDHFPVFYVRHFNNTKRVNTIPIRIRKIDDESKQKFSLLIENKDWANTLNDFDPESAFSDFFSFINKSYDECFPERIVKPRSIDKLKSPWMTPGLFVSRKVKMKLFSKKLRKPSPENLKRFKEYNNTYTKIIRKAKHKYYNDKFKEFSKDSKKTWQTINEILGRKKGFNDIPQRFVSNDKILSGSLEIAEGFNEFFVNIGPNLAKSIPLSNKHFYEYLGDPCNENFVFANMNHDIILDAMSKLNSKNSCGPDKISTNLLKFVAPNLLIPLTHLFNLSFKTGFIPPCLKTALIKPIFKKGDTDKFTNYRPISLLSPFSKLLEKVACSQIMRYLNKFKLLYEHQYGFRRGHSTEHPVVHLLDRIYKAFENPSGSKYTLAIFIDLTKAFDTCSVEILLSKLNHYGFRDVANLWFKNYLTGRTQFTSVRGENSSLRDILCGVPQGSILGPILFILLINDLPNASKFFSLLYADDTTLEMSSQNLIELYLDAKIELDKIADWFRANKLTLNISKTKYILFRDKSQYVDFSGLNLSIENEEIERIGEDCKEKFFKFVGVHLDEHLTWQYHINHVRGKAASANYALSKLRNLLPMNVKYTIYNSLFRSHIEFNILCWGRSQYKDIHKITTLQKRAVRYIANLKYNSHTGIYFKKLNILKFNDLVKLNQANFMYRYVYNKLPSSFDNFFDKLNNFNRSLSFVLPKINKNEHKLLPSFALIKTWNDVSLDLRRKKSLNSFKKHFSSALLENYDKICKVSACYACRK